MEGNYHKLLKSLKSVTPTSNLEGLILSKVNEEFKSRARQRLGLFGCGALGALGALVYSVRYMGEFFSHSGLYEYLSLAFVGDGTVFMYWKEFAFSIIDSLPLITLIALLGSLIAFIWLSATFWTNGRQLFGAKNLYQSIN